MEANRWHKIEEIFNTTLALPATDRRAYVDAACSHDLGLRGEVESLLREVSQPDEFFSESTFTLGARLLDQENTEALRFERIGAYSVLKLLGTGGMGHVFLAQDPRLERLVAVKLLPPSLITNVTSAIRFQQEARAASAISHPNIAHIYEFGQIEDRDYLVMEYVEGKTVRELLSTGPVEFKRALDIAIQVGEALDAAHEVGVVHRDIKPENIMVRRDGYAKVLDFGLAKITNGLTDNGGPKRKSSLDTSPGLIMGTTAYMSPEQIRGLSVDARSDIWSLAVTFYEMVAGTQPFLGNTPSDVSAAILVNAAVPCAPSWMSSYQASMFEGSITKALEKQFERRYTSVSEFNNDLKTLRATLNRNDQEVSSSDQATSRYLFPNTPAFLRTVQDRVRATGFSTKQFSWTKMSLLLSLTAVMSVVIILWFLNRPWRPTFQYQQPNANALKLYNQGVNAFLTGDLHRAAAYLDQSVKSDGQFILARAFRAAVWRDLDYSERASKDLDDVIEEESDLSIPRVESLYLAAFKAMVRKDFEIAVNCFTEISHLNSNDALVYVHLGHAYERNGELSNATAAYLEATKIEPSSSLGFLRLGIVYGKQKDEARATAAFDKAGRLYVRSRDDYGEVEVLLQRSILAANIGRLEQAKEYGKQTYGKHASFHQTIRIALHLAVCWYPGGASDGFKENALRLAEQHSRVGLFPHGADDLVVRGLIDIADKYMEGPQVVEGQSLYLRAINIARRSGLRTGLARAHFAHGKLNLSNHFFEEADNDFKEALKLEFPNEEISDRSIALWRTKLGDKDYDSAVLSFRKEFLHRR